MKNKVFKIEKQLITLINQYDVFSKYTKRSLLYCLNDIEVVATYRIKLSYVFLMAYFKYVNSNCTATYCDAVWIRKSQFF